MYMYEASVTLYIGKFPSFPSQNIEGSQMGICHRIPKGMNLFLTSWQCRFEVIETNQVGMEYVNRIMSYKKIPELKVDEKWYQSSTLFLKNLTAPAS